MTIRIEGDVAFQSQRRFFQQTAARAGVKSWGYIFTQPQPSIPPSFGGKRSVLLGISRVLMVLLNSHSWN